MAEQEGRERARQEIYYMGETGTTNGKMREQRGYKMKYLKVFLPTVRDQNECHLQEKVAEAKHKAAG